MKAFQVVALCSVATLPVQLACPGAQPCQTEADCSEREICVNQACIARRPVVLISDAGVPADVVVHADTWQPDTSSAPDTATQRDSSAQLDTASQHDTRPPSDAAVAPDRTSAPDTATPDAAVGQDQASSQDGATSADATSTDAALGSDAGGTDAGSADAACTAHCGTRVCGDDGCGGSCGPCNAPTPACQNGACVACAVDGDCATGKCEKYTGTCLVRACIYDEHCSVGYYGHCSSTYACVSGHDCDNEMAYIPYPWDDSMTVSVEGNTSDADSNFSPTGSCGSANGPEDIYEFNLPRAVQKVTITLEAGPSTSSWDSAVYVAASICGSTNVGCADSYPNNQPEVLVLNNPSYSTLTIVADGYAGSDDGPYRLTVMVDECDGDGDCNANERCLSPAADSSRCIRD
ncbi:MAG: hypothetical protein ABIJ09_03800 [Pseudomonadota bacterium]